LSNVSFVVFYCFYVFTINSADYELLAWQVSSSRDRKILPGGQKAFTGSIVEHDEGLSAIEQPRSNDSEKAASSASSSRPMSRFKMQKGGR
uniref:Uncharacterized protein n=1 Tax=Aegilops tauschii subsp. strangulata TaxID=200361 RepID=A0A453GEF1_AEGTS